MNGSSAFQFRLHRFGLDALMNPQRPRSRWLKFVYATLGSVLMAALLVLGVLVGAVMVLSGLLRRALHRPDTAARSPGRVLDADYRVVESKPERRQ